MGRLEETSIRPDGGRWLGHFSTSSGFGARVAIRDGSDKAVSPDDAAR